MGSDSLVKQSYQQQSVIPSASSVNTYIEIIQCISRTEHQTINVTFIAHENMTRKCLVKEPSFLLIAA